MKKIALVSLFCFFLPFLLSAASRPEVFQDSEIANSAFWSTVPDDPDPYEGLDDLILKLDDLGRIYNPLAAISFFGSLGSILLLSLFTSYLTLFLALGCLVLFIVGYVLTLVNAIDGMIIWGKIMKKLTLINDPEVSKQVRKETRRGRRFSSLWFPLILLASIVLAIYWARFDVV